MVVVVIRVVIAVITVVPYPDQPHLNQPHPPPHRLPGTIWKLLLNISHLPYLNPT